jgi:hypothetical protein
MEDSSKKESLDRLMEEYLKTLCEKERKSYDIAKEHLGTSFQLEKSVGFLTWKKTQTS